MNQQEQKALFDELVTKKIVCTEFGFSQLPIAGLREFHERAGLPDDEVSFLVCHLPGASEDYFNFVLGVFDEEDASIEINSVFFYDEDTERPIELGYNDALVDVLDRLLSDGEAYCTGEIVVDHYGRVWLPIMLSDDFGMDLIITLKPDGLGVPIYAGDLATSWRIWYDGELFSCSPTTIFFYGSQLPS